MQAELSETFEEHEKHLHQMNGEIEKKGINNPAIDASDIQLETKSQAVNGHIEKSQNGYDTRL